MTAEADAVNASRTGMKNDLLPMLDILSPASLSDTEQARTLTIPRLPSEGKTHVFRLDTGAGHPVFGPVCRRGLTFRLRRVANRAGIECARPLRHDGRSRDAGRRRASQGDRDG